LTQISGQSVRLPPPSIQDSALLLFCSVQFSSTPIAEEVAREAKRSSRIFGVNCCFFTA
jgi:hypothetical protein